MGKRVLRDWVVRVGKVFCGLRGVNFRGESDLV